MSNTSIYSETSRILELEKELQHWKSNHSDMVNRCAILTQREDLPVDRIPAYKELIRLQAENKAAWKLLEQFSKL